MLILKKSDSHYGRQVDALVWVVEAKCCRTLNLNPPRRIIYIVLVIQCTEGDGGKRLII